MLPLFNINVNRPLFLLFFFQYMLLTAFLICYFREFDSKAEVNAVSFKSYILSAVKTLFGDVSNYYQFYVLCVLYRCHGLTCSSIIFRSLVQVSKLIY